MMYDDFFAKAHELVQQGKPFVTATVVWAEKPTSGKPGDKAIVTVDGTMHGWIGGSCAQPTVIQEGLKALAADETRLIRLSIKDPDSQSSPEGVIDLPMTCYSGGTLEIYLEPQHPRPRLLIVGTLPVAQALAHLGSAMNYHVIVVDLDGEGGDLPHADVVLTDLEALADEIRPHTYIVVATHGNYDEVSLETILPLHPTYVGLVASPTRATAVREYLTTQGLAEAELSLLKAPAGLDIQARRGDEIALSIMAEIVQKRRNAELLDLALFHEGEAAHEAAHGAAHEAAHGAAEETAVAIDPICGMEVTKATAHHKVEYKDETYYFCCPGCQTTFSKDPEAYISSPEPG
jgi:xanthine dehydrogenase accessory factor